MRNMPISEAWNETLAFVGREAGLVFPVAFAFIALPGILLQYAMPAPVPGAEPQPGAWMLLILPLAAATLFGTLTISVMALRGGLSVAEAIGAAGRRMLPLLGAALLIGIGGTLLFLPVGLAFALLGATQGALTAIATFAILLVFLFIGVRLVFLNPVAAVEPLGPVAIIRRAWAMTRGHFWKLFGFFVILLVVTLVVSMAVTAIAGIVLTLTLGRPDESEIARLLLLVVSGLINTVVSVYTVVLIARLYAKVSAG